MNDASVESIRACSKTLTLKSVFESAQMGTHLLSGIFNSPYIIVYVRCLYMGLVGISGLK